MERKTKHRLLGMFVVTGLVMASLPLLQSSKDLSSEANLVKAPPFPEQTQQVASSETAESPLIQSAVNQFNQESDGKIHLDQSDIVPIASNTQAAVNQPKPSDAAAPAATSAPVNADQAAVQSAPVDDSAVQDVDPDGESTVQAKPIANAPNTSEANNSQVIPIASPLDNDTPKPAKVKSKKAVHHPEAISAEPKKAIQVTKQPYAVTKVRTAAVEPINDNGLFKVKEAVWVIQLGSFKNKANALRLVNQLRASGYRAFIQQVSTDGGDSTRVFVGPEAQQASARELATQLESNLHLRGFVISYKPLTL